MNEITKPTNALTDFFNHTPDLVCVAKRDGYFQEINQAVIKKLGYSKKELFERPISSFIHPDDREMTAKERQALLNGKPLLNFQNRYLTKKGEVVWLQWTSVYDEEQEIVFAIAKDVTDKKNAELELESKYQMLQQLNQHFKKSMEEDRRSFSVKLHEELAQVACVIKMDMDWIQSHANNLAEEGRKRLQHAIAATDLLIGSMQKISYATDPGLLPDVDLNEALAWQFNEFSRLHGIEVRYGGVLAEGSLPKKVQLELFRICQELLSHFQSYTNARMVTIEIKETKTTAMIILSDDRTGSKVQVTEPSGSLLSVEQRLIAINGTMVTKSLPGQGEQTIITICKQEQFVDGID